MNSRGLAEAHQADVSFGNSHIDFHRIEFNDLKYNVSPQDPDPAYGQFVVNTNEEKATPALVAELRNSLAAQAPEALVIVKQLQQGMTMEAPVEIRIVGYDVAELQQIGTRVEAILHGVPYAQLIHNDDFGDSYLVDVDINTEISNRLG